jgi:hypothetical protein
MLQMNRRLVKQLKTVFRRALNLPTRGMMPTIELTGGPDGLRIRCATCNAFAKFYLKGPQPDETMFIPFELLGKIEGDREVSVEICSRDDGVVATWLDGSVPQVAQCPRPEVVTKDWPAMPEVMTENPPALLASLAEASATSDPISGWRALDCIQLQGGNGKIVATDGKQLLVQSGFAFGWEGDILIPASRLFGTKQLAGNEPVLVGCSDGWFVLRIGPWTFWEQINKDGCFPNVESIIIGYPELAAVSVELSAADREFLVKNLPRLPCDDEKYSAVTVDLSGSVVIRGKRSDQSHATELVLSASTCSGKPSRFTTNRRFLQRALQLGFDRLYYFSTRCWVLAYDDRRQYVWLLLNDALEIAPDKQAIRVEMPVNV